MLFSSHSGGLGSTTSDICNVVGDELVGAGIQIAASMTSSGSTGQTIANDAGILYNACAVQQRGGGIPLPGRPTVQQQQQQQQRAAAVPAPWYSKWQNLAMIGGAVIVGGFAYKKFVKEA